MQWLGSALPRRATSVEPFGFRQLPESLKQLELVFSSLEWHLPEYLEEISIHPVLFMLSTLYSQQASLTFAAQLPVRMVIVWLNEEVVLRR